MSKASVPLENWNNIEKICDRCNKSILNDYMVNHYKKIPNFFRENYCLFCKCNKLQNELTLIELNDHYIINYKIKKNIM
jgi:hypothetical protein